MVEVSGVLHHPAEVLVIRQPRTGHNQGDDNEVTRPAVSPTNRRGKPEVLAGTERLGFPQSRIEAYLTYTLHVFFLLGAVPREEMR